VAGVKSDYDVDSWGEGVGGEAMTAQGKPEGGVVCEAAGPPGVFAGDAQLGDRTEGSRCRVRCILVKVKRSESTATESFHTG
jgi:hypothetical protein